MSDLVEVHLTHLRAGGLSRHTIEDRRKLLKRLQRDLPHGLDAATTDELAVWLGRDGWAVKTRATFTGHVVSYYRWAAGGRHPHLDYNPADELIRPKAPPGLPRPVTLAQLEHTLATADDLTVLAVTLAAGAGMRASEVAQADRDDFTVDQVTILGKGGKTRSVPTHPDVWALIERLPAGRIIHRPRGGTAEGDWLSRYVSRHLTAIGLPDVTLHRFRHFFGTVIQREYKDLRVTQELMGHASPNTTAGYAQVTDGQRRLAISTLPALHANSREEAAA